MEINEITEKIIGAAITVHKNLGPGFLESVYQAALAYEMSKNNLAYEKEKEMPVSYRDVILDIGFRCDFLVENKVIVECKAVKALAPVDEAQLLNYLMISSLHAGLLINFHVLKLKEGIKRIVNNL
ncbi:MAG TPA: GxxExxY protein [Spirochaetia bacterium]|nr:GxxExxY protein [Spirochaetia bacterium]